MAESSASIVKLQTKKGNQMKLLYILAVLLTCPTISLYGDIEDVSATQACVGEDITCESVIGGGGKKTAVVECKGPKTKCNATVNG